MIYQPVDEASLRHLFSSDYARDVLGLAYLGPVLDLQGRVDTSPDAIIVDMRKSPYRPLRCEFKFSPTDLKDFAHNGRFEIAIVWELRPGTDKVKLETDLAQSNGCSELLILSDYKAFSNLPPYNN